ncbi:uncharacterized protein LOC144744006 [Ciona intestinalis]
MHLLFDYAHLLKCIRNNWLTEKCGEIQYKDEKGEECFARWSDLRSLFKAEEGSLVTQSKLNYVSVYPRPIERQNVQTCLRVFCDETIVALETHSAVSGCDNAGTINFLKMFVNFWNVVNVRKHGINIRFRDPRKAVMSSCDDSRLNEMAKLAEDVRSMSSCGRGRVKQLSSDTCSAFNHTCHGFISLTKVLLQSTHDFVLLGHFSTDPLEKAFGKLRQGCGGTYFINTQQVLEKHAIIKAKLALQRNVDISSIGTHSSGHSCTMCSYKLSPSDIELFDDLPAKESAVSFDEIQAIVYISGYIVRKDNDLNLDDTYNYYEKYGSYTQCLNRSGLQLPNDMACQWAILCYVMFSKVKSKVCRKSLSSIFQLVSDYYAFNMDNAHCHILSNILLNRWCKSVTPYLGKEPAQKLLKLT